MLWLLREKGKNTGNRTTAESPTTSELA